MIKATSKKIMILIFVSLDLECDEDEVRDKSIFSLSKVLNNDNYFSPVEGKNSDLFIF